jgi:hypothetical protein
MLAACWRRVGGVEQQLGLYFIKCSETGIVLFYIIMKLLVIIKTPNP